MSMDDSAPRREEMLVMKVGSGITAENVGTIATVMFIESGYDELDAFENKLILQQGKNSTYFLLGELPDEITYEKMVSSIGATLGVTLTITTNFAEEYLAGASHTILISVSFPSLSHSHFLLHPRRPKRHTARRHDSLHDRRRRRPPGGRGPRQD